MTRRLRWLLWAGVLVAATAAMLAARGVLDKAHVALVYLLVVLGASAHVGRSLGITVAVAAFFVFNVLFLPPYGTLVVANPLDWLVLLAFLLTSAVAAQLLYRARATAETATARALEVDRLAALGAASLSAPGAHEALQAIVVVIHRALGVDECEVFQRVRDDALVRAARAASDGVRADDTLAERGGRLAWIAHCDQSAVLLADGSVRLAAPELRPPGAERSGSPWGVVQAAGAQVLQYAVRGATPEVRAVLLPLVVRDHTVGVLRVASAGGVRLTPEQARLLVALAQYAALGAERVRLVESAERAEAERRMEALRSALLTAVSHDLRTPLTTIKGIAHEIARGASASDRATIIETEADRLDALVGDLLDLSRIQAGAVRPDVAVNTVDELLGAALQRAAGALRRHDVQLDASGDELLAGRFDLTQTVRVLVNLLENAAKYAPAGTPIDVRARRDGDTLAIAVLDRGPGVPDAEAGRIFEPFYRPPTTPADVRGTGLGLSIARGLAEAQGGRVRYAPRDGGGSAFTLHLPAVDVSTIRRS